MKFSIHCVRGNQARLGILTEVGRHRNKTLETPLCMLYSKGGSAPYMSADLLKRLQDVPDVMHMPLNQLVQYQETISGYKDGIAKFAGVDNLMVYTSNNDPAVEAPAGYNSKSGMALWGKGGKTQLDCAGFLQLLEAIIPDWYQCMADGDTDKTSTAKRITKSVDRTLSFLDIILENLKKYQNLQNSALFGSIVGGYDVKARQRCIKETMARNLQGFVIEGFHGHGPTTEDFDWKEQSELLSTITKSLPEDKPRLMHSIWRPDSVLTAIELGVDMFDSSYPLIVTERGHALIFNFCYTPDPERDNTDMHQSNGFTINLNDEKYVDEFTPLLKDCKCYTCQNFTKAYINHLLNTSELLASTLLMLHNFHHYFQYFKMIRKALEQDKFEQLKTLIIQQAQKTKTTE